jgi:hypothetical protein
MKLSITKITLLFVLFISFLIGYVHMHNRTEYQILNVFVLNKYKYHQDVLFTINDSIIKRRNKAEYDKLMHSFMNLHNNFEKEFHNENNQVILKSPFVKIELTYELNDFLTFRIINIETTNRTYCEN